MDNDDLLEQDHNEDWMDSVVRTKKQFIVIQAGSQL